MPARPSSADSVLGKAVALLTALAADNAHPPLGLSALSRASGLNKATTYRLANELVTHRLLEHTSAGYRLGSLLFELGQRVPRYYDIAHDAEPFVDDLHRTTGQTVHLSVRDGTEMLYLLKIRGHKGIDQPSRVAGRLPAHCTATGRAILAFESPNVVAEVLATELKAITRHTLVHPSTFLQKLGEARDAGTATETEEVELGLGAVAAPVFGPIGPVAAIGIVVRLKEGRPEQFRTAVRKSALHLSRILSGSSR